MKKTLIPFALSVALVSFAAPVFAQENEKEMDLQVSVHEENQLPQDIYEEMGTVSLELGDLAALTAADDTLTQRRRGRRGRDGINRDRGRYERDRRRDGRHRRRWDSRRRRWIPIPIPFPRYRTVCFARNNTGRVFRATGFGSRRSILNAAYRACRRMSARPNTCRALGCR
jgi:hypothetical protein